MYDIKNLSNKMTTINYHKFKRTTIAGEQNML